MCEGKAGECRERSVRSDREKLGYYRALEVLVSLWDVPFGSSDRELERALLEEIREFPIDWLPEKRGAA